MWWRKIGWVGLSGVEGKDKMEWRRVGGGGTGRGEGTALQGGVGQGDPTLRD